MTLLEVRPNKSSSWSYDVYSDEDFLTNITLSWWQSKTEKSNSFDFDGTTYQIIREPGWGAFVLSDSAGEICRAVKPSAWFRSFDITINDETWVLKAAFPGSRSFDLVKNDKSVGHVSTKGFFRNRATTEFPDEIPLPNQLFMIWLVIVIWRRDDAESASSGPSVG